MPIRPGQSLSHYEILGPLGAGAMGEVFRARDTRLDREVAIKVLPEHFADDEERLRRFEREARTLATLNHPSVAQIHGVDQVGDTCFLVLELVPGETLEERLKRGPLPLDEAVEVCRQIAEGLEAAHEAGVIHRDLKPANVRITPEGKVKVLDFGLAKPMRPGQDVKSTDSVLSTEQGRLLGTPTYMAPEQARGRAIDRRVDVWAFGCVLYECLTGERAFGGETLSDVLGSVLRDEPDLSRLPAATPRAVRELVASALVKDPRQRLRDIGDARLALEAVTREPGIAPGGARSASPGWKIAAAVLVLVVVALVLERALRVAPVTLPVPLRGAVVPGAGFVGGSTTAISPDGTALVYPAEVLEGVGSDLLVRKLAEFVSRPLGLKDAGNPFFSPDGKWIAYSDRRRRVLMRVPLSGGAPIEIAPVDFALSGCWLSNGDILVPSAVTAEGKLHQGLVRIPAAGGAATILTRVRPGEQAHLSPCALPGGEKLLFAVSAVDGFDLAVADLATGEHRVIGSGASPVFVPGGRLVFYQPGLLRLEAVRFDPVRGEMIGTPVAVVENVARQWDGMGGFALGADGTLIYSPSDPTDAFGGQYAVAWVDREGAVAPVIEEKATWAQPRMSPDGRQLLLRKTATPNCSLWLFDLERGSMTRLTFENDPHDAIWHPDGKRILFTLDDAVATRRIYVQPVDGSAPPAPLRADARENELSCSVSRDGAWLAITRSPLETGSDIWIVPLAGGGEARPFATTAHVEDAPAFSPDGKWIAYTSDESGIDEVYVRPWPEPGGKYQVSTRGGKGPAWTPDGRTLIYAEGLKLVAADVETQAGFRAGKPRVFLEGAFAFERVGNFDLAADGRIVIVQRSGGSTLPRDLRVVFGWTQELARLVP